MRRKCTDELIRWKKKKNRKPLILRGTRQTGKTWLLQDFGSRQYKNTAYINLETDRPVAEFFAVPRDSAEVLLFLESYTNTPIHQDDSLLILDNLQCVPFITHLLPEFALNFPECHIAAIEKGFSLTYDVHEFDFLTLAPLDFEEFLWANADFALGKEIRNHFLSKTPMGKALHEKALARFRLYLTVGGMPTAVLEYRKEKSLLMVPDVQRKILDLFLADIGKADMNGNDGGTNKTVMTDKAAVDGKASVNGKTAVASNATVTGKVRVSAAHCHNSWLSIPGQLGGKNNKFQYSQITRGATARIYESPLRWLAASGMLLRSFRCSPEFTPTDAASFRLYYPDSGLNACQLGLPFYLLLSGQETPPTQSCIETCLAATFTSNGYRLAFWSSLNQAEVPFLLEKADRLTAVCYRMDPHHKTRSLARVKELCNVDQMYLLSTEDFKVNELYAVVPFYAAFCI